VAFVLAAGVATLVAVGGATSGPAVAARANSGNSVVSQAKAAVKELTSPVTKWTGPTTGPKAKPGKNIAFVSLQQSNPAVSGWGVAIQQAAKHLGWHVTIYDGQGTTDGQTTALQSAIAAKPDGIVMGALQVTQFQPQLKKAASLHIPVVGIHSAADVGAYGKQNMFYNVAQSTAAIGRAAADYVIAASNGTAKAVILTDRSYPIALDKANAEKNEFEKCKGCKLLAFVNAPLATISTRAGQEVSSLISQYGTSLQYMMSIADFYYDNIVPALRSSSVPTSQVKLVGTDGTSTAYQRIRQGQYQVATIPGSLTLEGWSAVDELNRAMNAKPAFNFPLPLHLVTKADINSEGGKKDEWLPANNFEKRYLKIWGVK
jgi:ribose transport system substrate-binding protein